MTRTLMGLSAAKELNDSLRAAVDTQRALADKVGRLVIVLLSPVSNSFTFLIILIISLSQVEAMKEVGVFFSGLVQELAGLREAAVKGLSSLQAEQGELEDKIRQAQERHHTVRDAKQTDAKRERKPLSELVNSPFFPQSTSKTFSPMLSRSFHSLLN